MKMYRLTHFDKLILDSIAENRIASVARVHSYFADAHLVVVMRAIHTLHHHGYLYQKHHRNEALYCLSRNMKTLAYAKTKSQESVFV